MSNLETPDDESDGEFESIIGNFDGSLEALKAFDELRKDFYDALALFVTQLDDTSSKPEIIQATLPVLTPLVKDIVLGLTGGDEDSDTPLVSVVDLILQDATERAVLLNNLLGSVQLIDTHEHEGLTEYFTALHEGSESREEFAEKVAAFYQHDLTGDVVCFMQALEKKHIAAKSARGNRDPQEQIAKLEITKSPHEHALDVAKIAAGVFLAIFLDRKWRGRS